MIKKVIMEPLFYIPWEQYPKHLSYPEFQDPLSVIADFFSIHPIKSHRRTLKRWRKYVVNAKIYKDKRYDHGPGTLLFEYEIIIKLIEAAYLLLVNYENNLISRNKLSESFLNEGKSSWPYFPGNLSAEQMENPYLALKKAFKKSSLQDYRSELWVWLSCALYRDPMEDGVMEPGNLVLVYDSMLKIYSAAWLIHMREKNDNKNESKETIPAPQPD